MKSYSSREVIEILKADGWYEVACVGGSSPVQAPFKKGKSHSHTPEKRHSCRNT